MKDEVLDPNLFIPLDTIEEFDCIVGDEINRKYYFRYNGTDNQYGARLYGRPETTGINTTGLVTESNNLFSVQIFGRPKQIGKNTQVLKLFNRESYSEFKIVYHVAPLKFLDYSLPDALELFKPYTARIHFYNPSQFVPKFSYNFPFEFGKVESEFETGRDYTTIRFSPSRPGKYKFRIVALGEIKKDGGIENIELGSKTLHIEVLDSSPKIKSKPVFVKSIPISDWK